MLSYTPPETFMSAGQLCSWMWLTFLLVWLLFAFRRKPTLEREPAFSRFLYSIPTVLAFYLLLAGQAPYEWLRFRIVSPMPALRIVGITLTALGIGFAIWARFYIGENWSGSVTVKVGHELIRTGPYSWVRHPIYSGMLLAALGTGLVGGQIRSVIAVPLLWLGFWMKTRVEERFMLKTFGAQYQEYSRSTGALIPRLH